MMPADDVDGSLVLSAARLDLWLVRTDEAYDTGLIAQCRTLLSGVERERERGFYFAQDRHRYLMTRALVRDVLSRYCAIAPRDWLFDVNAYGRPLIANADPLAQRISFNLSHTNGLIVLGVIGERALGVDTESLMRAAPLDIAESVLTDSEVDALRRLPADEQARHFFDIWTLKESYIKARGMGLSISPRSLNFEVDGVAQIRFAPHASLEDDAERWLFRQWMPSASHLVAVCVEGAAMDLPHTVMRQMLPCRPAHVLYSSIVRSSLWHRKAECSI